jgi:hypothetical protein
MSEEFVPQHPGEKVVWEQEVDLSEDGNFGVDPRLLALSWRFREDTEYVNRVAGEILSEYYGEHDAK